MISAVRASACLGLIARARCGELAGLHRRRGGSRGAELRLRPPGQRQGAPERRVIRSPSDGLAQQGNGSIRALGQAIVHRQPGLSDKVDNAARPVVRPKRPSSGDAPGDRHGPTGHQQPAGGPRWRRVRPWSLGRVRIGGVARQGRAGEPVAGPGDGLDAERVRRHRSGEAADRADRAVQGIVADDLAVPAKPAELVAGDDAPFGADQNQQHLHDARLDGGASAEAVDLPRRRVDPRVPEPERSPARQVRSGRRS